jgi:hypothetical protein
MKKIQLLILILFLMVIAVSGFSFAENLTITDGQAIVSDTRIADDAIEKVIQGKYTGAIPEDTVTVGVYGEMGNTTAAGAIVGTGHGIGVLGFASDTTLGVHPIYGVEGRANIYTEQSGIYGYGTLGLANVEADTYGGVAVGVKARSEIFDTGGSPLAEGGAIALWVPHTIGGAYHYGIFCQDDVKIAGDTTMQNLTFDGGGMCYAEIYALDNSTATSIASATTEYQVTVFDTNGVSNNATPDHTNDHITITQAGDYLINFTATISNEAGDANLMKLYIKKNNGASVVGSLQFIRVFYGWGGEQDVAKLSGMATLAASDTIEVWVENLQNTQDYTFEDITLNVMQIGD